MADKTKGLISKFYVRRFGDPTHKHVTCKYFVLDPQHDPIARTALHGYAVEALNQGFNKLAEDLNQWLSECEPFRSKKSDTDSSEA